MNPKSFRVFIFVFMFLAQGLYSQSYSQGLSDGRLEINGQSTEVKIFATSSIADFNQFIEKLPPDNILIFLNETVNEYAQTSVFQDYIAKGFVLLDRDFQPIISEKSPENYAYFYKATVDSQLIKTGDKVFLHTPFKIWNPSKGIKIGSFTLHFYSLMFVLAFGLGHFIMSYMFKTDGVNAKYLEPLFTWTLLGTILGARLGHVIFYQPELFKQDFWSVFLPIQTQPEFKFTGFSGLASHGATIALIFTTLYYSLKIIKKNPLWVYDRLGIVVALGGAFVRLGNFFNSEIIGKPVDEHSPFAILFLQMSSEYGPTIPRYPTQLFEAFGYVLLFIVLFTLYRYTRKKYQQGWLFGLFFVILWSIRFVVEFFKEPQGDEFIQVAGLNTGQVLSIPFVIAGVIIMVISRKFLITEKENQKLD